MDIIFNDQGTVKTKVVKEFSLKGNYIFADKQYLTGSEGGWIHASQIINQTDEPNANYSTTEVDSTR